jgi:hypothetical protein
MLLTVAALIAAIACAARSDHFAGKAAALEADRWGIPHVHDHRWCIQVFCEFHRRLMLRRGYFTAGVFFVLSAVPLDLTSFAGRFGWKLLEVGAVFGFLGLVRLIVLRAAVLKSRFQEGRAKAATALAMPLTAERREIA